MKLKPPKNVRQFIPKCCAVCKHFVRVIPVEEIKPLKPPKGDVFACERDPEHNYTEYVFMDPYFTVCDRFDRKQ